MTNIAQQPGTIDKLYALNGGIAVSPDHSIHTPGKWVGEMFTMPCNAYLIRRGGSWILWDTGISDAVGDVSGGVMHPHGLRGIVTRTIRRQLADLGLEPADIDTVVLSHAHFDHIGNAGLFGHATWYIQRVEHDAMFGAETEKYGFTPALYDNLRAAKVELMDGDHDLFGDGSMRVLFSPGHTCGHCSLLVRLPNTGAVLLSADIAHDHYNLENRCVPTFNIDADATRASMDRIAAIAAEENAALWINHDIVQMATIPHAPASFD